MQQMKLNDPITLEEGYQDLLVGFERKPYGAPEGLRNIQRMMGSLNPNVSRVKVDDLIDNRFVRKLDESGLHRRALRQALRVLLRGINERCLAQID